VKEGDEIAISTGAHKTRAKVISVSEYATKESAAGMFEVLEKY